MGVFCACAQTQTNGNTGTSNAALQLKRPSCYYFVPTFADDGTKNVILSTDFDANGKLPALFIEEKLNHADPSKRWYPVPNLRTTTNERADPETQSFDGGQNAVITAEGVRTVNATVIDANAKYKNNLDRLSCKYRLSFFEIDECGSMGGEESANDSTIFEPHPIARKNFYTKLVKAQGTDAQTLMLMFEYDQKSEDGKECIIPASAIDAELCDEEGLLNLLVGYSAIANAAFTATLKLEYGGFGGNIAQTGLVAADFVLKDLTAGVDIAITSVTESPDGTYAFVTAAMTAGNTMQLQIADDGTKYTKPFEIQSKTFTAVA